MKYDNDYTLKKNIKKTYYITRIKYKTYGVSSVRDEVIPKRRIFRRSVT